MPDASHYYVITVGADAQVSSLRFASTAATVSASTFEHLDSASISALAVLAGDAFVGSHFAIIGAEADVYAVAAILGASGVMREEMSVVAMDHDSEPQQGILWSSADSRRRVFCAHCHETFETTAGPTHTVLCAHCDNSLTIDPYFSRVRAAYLGTYTP